MRPTSHLRLFTLSAASTVLALTASLLVLAYPTFAQQNSDTNTPPHFVISATAMNVLWSDYNEADVNIGSPFVAEDAEGDEFSYSVREDGSDNYFQIDISGQLKTTDEALPDPDLSDLNKATYSISVSVCEVGVTNYLLSRCDNISVTINVVKDKESIENPVIAGHSRLEHPENSVEVATYTAFTPDDRSIGWTMSGVGDDDDGFLFSIGHYDGVLSFKEPPDYDPTGDNSYSVLIMGYTGKYERSWFSVAVTVVDVDEAPTFDDQTTTRSIAENTGPGVDIGDPVAATDDDDDTLTYTLDGDDAVSFDIVSTSGQLQTKSALDFETKASYTVTVSVRDSEDANGAADTAADDEITVTITVADVNEAPAFPAAEDGLRTVPENSAAGQNIGAPVVATDDEDDTLTYSLDETAALLFAIDSETGQITVGAGTTLDHETTASYAVTVSVRDSKADDGVADTVTDDTITVTITVTDVNEAPAFPAAEDGLRTIPENSAAGENIGLPVTATDPDNSDTLTYTLDATSAASFGIVAMSGQLQTKVPLDHETTPSYTVIVSVSDGKDTSGAPDSTTDDEITVTINVTDVNDAPEFDGETATRSIAENTAAGENIGAPITATDQDNGDVLTYFLSPTSALFFHIVPTSGQLQTKIALDHEATVRYSMYVFVRDSKDANGAADTLKDDKIEVNITVTDVNDAPEFDGETATRLIAENTAAGENIGAPITARDDDDATLTYTLGDGDDDASFDIVEETGQLQTKDALDHETKASYSVTVSVSDGKDVDGTTDTVPDDTITVTITVTNVNQTPAFDGAPATRSIPENTEAGEDIGAPITATDDDDATLTYTLGDGADDASFDIVEDTGQLQTKVPLDHETKASYSVTVSVSDGKNANGAADPATDATITVTITVTDVDEPPPGLGLLAIAVGGARQPKRTLAGTRHSRHSSHHWLRLGIQHRGSVRLAFRQCRI